MLGRYLWKRLFQPSPTVLTPDFFMLPLEKTLDLKIYIGKGGERIVRGNNKNVYLHSND